ncbi:serine hydrolase domain-containing protein [Phenylobacterium sp.]|uniref:serine hydrolase domain-containing protein n=1 Tax=Phenylobacterium sp. TaxID=1871053 RepID=UPI003982FFC4
MRRLIGIGLATVLAAAAWCVLVVFATLEGWGRQPLAPRAEPRAFMQAAVSKIGTGHPGNLAMVLIDDARVVDSHFVSRGRPVDGDTLFQVASLSKWITAWGVMTLVQDGRLDLDAPVDSYLSRWKLPPSAFDNSQVTVRRLLSHTAGLTDGLGYGGFAPGKPIQTLEASLTRAADASPGAEGAVRVGAEPGGAWDYSGGGYTLLQLVIEEVSGEPFAAYMRRAVLAPLGMNRSTFELPAAGASNLAAFYDTDGSEATHYRFTATGAASLYTSVADLTRFIQAQMPGPGGAAPGRGVLSPATLELMRTPHAKQYGADIWGLGVILYAPNGAGGYSIGHDGSNAPAINTAARFDPASGDGIVVLETGNRQLATKLAGDWVFWNTGKVDTMSVMMQAGQMLRWLAVGSGAILVAGLAAAVLTRRRRTLEPTPPPL